MSDKKSPAPRGEAAYQAQKAAIAKRNDATQKRGAASREAREARHAEAVEASDRLEESSRPQQPGRS